MVEMQWFIIGIRLLHLSDNSLRNVQYIYNIIIYKIIEKSSFLVLITLNHI